jgi:hypothetical protein
MPKKNQMPDHVGLASKMALDKKIKQLMMQGKFDEAKPLIDKRNKM